MAHCAGTVGFEEGVTAYAKNKTAIVALKGEYADLKQKEQEAAQHAVISGELAKLAHGTIDWADATDDASGHLKTSTM